MSTEPVRPRRPSLAWALPAGVVVVVAAAITIPMVASASPALPQRSAAQLLVDVSKAAGTSMSGTVVETARLGLPALPETGGSAITPTALLAGSHTARVWYDGGQRSRVAVVGNLAETDLVRNGRDVWLWTSGANTAQHVRLPAHPAGGTDGAAGGTGSTGTPTAASVTPQQAAQQALAAVDPTTRVTVDGTASVAGRSAYELVLQPRDSRSLVGDVRIAVDSRTGVPLRVQVHAAGHTGRPAFETAFTSVTFAKPSATVFAFSPPPGAKVSDLSAPAGGGARPGAGATTKDAAPTVTGSGWTAVVEVPGVSLPTAAANGSRDARRSTAGELAALTKAMTPVHGSFGDGKVLKTALVSVLLLDDGRLFVGSVAPSVLEQAAAK